MTWQPSAQSRKHLEAKKSVPAILGYFTGLAKRGPGLLETPKHHGLIDFIEMFWAAYAPFVILILYLGGRSLGLVSAAC